MRIWLLWNSFSHTFLVSASHLLSGFQCNSYLWFLSLSEACPGKLNFFSVWVTLSFELFSDKSITLSLISSILLYCVFRVINIPLFHWRWISLFFILFQWGNFWDGKEAEQFYSAFTLVKYQEKTRISFIICFVFILCTSWPL